MTDFTGPPELKAEGSNISAIGAARRARGTPLDEFAVLYRLWEVDGRPDVSLIGKGDQVASIDFRELGRDLAYASISLGNLGRDVKIPAPVAVATFMSDGTVNVQLELTKFGARADREWLNERFADARRISGEILDNEEAGRNAAPSDG